ncbi:hypothetical protein [Streptomyces sp. NPDC002467]|uniref:hypothetical protein n=1 Tax=Streptomyces sp. NPDC002467 TaxID=3364647 RepID=UPI0036B70362
MREDEGDLGVVRGPAVSSATLAPDPARAGVARRVRFPAPHRAPQALVGGTRGTSRGADYVVNTRHDDVAYVHMSDGTVHCIKPWSSYSFVNDEPMRYADGVRISSSTC